MTPDGDTETSYPTLLAKLEETLERCFSIGWGGGGTLRLISVINS
jgi:hypothetical protein